MKEGTTRHPPLKVPVGVDECMIMMEVDTGASISVVSQSVFDKLRPGRVNSTVGRIYATSVIKVRERALYSKCYPNMIKSFKKDWALTLGHMFGLGWMLKSHPKILQSVHIVLI